VPYDALPEYSAGFDVGIIPFVVNELTRSVNPIKLLEYLACGLGVVSTDMPEVRRFSEHVRIASGGDDFVDGIEAALNESSDDFSRSRRGVAASHSWESIAERFCGHIGARLEKNMESPGAGTQRTGGLHGCIAKCHGRLNANMPPECP
jgi:glycosyltransferase involved in cell wall biosynthesis